MSLPITFHRAANAEFIEASAWYEGKRLGLGLEFIAEIDRCVSLASKNPLQFAVVREDIRRVVANCFPYSVYFRAVHIALLSWRYFMATEIPPFGRREPNLTFERDCREAARVSPST